MPPLCRGVPQRSGLAWGNSVGGSACPVFGDRVSPRRQRQRCRGWHSMIGTPPLADLARCHRATVVPIHACASKSAISGGSLWQWARGGFTLASRPEMRRRQTIYQGCEHYQLAARKSQKCGSGVTGVVALKPWLKSAKCPIGRWKLPRGSHHDNGKSDRRATVRSGISRA
jgi:hypothetical protein